MFFMSNRIKFFLRNLVKYPQKWNHRHITSKTICSQKSASQYVHPLVLAYLYRTMCNKISQLHSRLLDISSVLINCFLVLFPTLQTQKAKRSNSARKYSPSPIPAYSKLPPLTVDNRRETEEILNSILPPREWEEEGQLWRQQVYIKHTRVHVHIHTHIKPLSTAWNLKG
jgi:hypothetical protein